MRTEQWEEGYEVGYREGESSASATWEMHLDVESPAEVKRNLDELRAACEALVALERIYDTIECSLCWLCWAHVNDALFRSSGGRESLLLTDHEPDCPWRMAKEALA